MEERKVNANAANAGNGPRYIKQLLTGRADTMTYELTALAIQTAVTAYREAAERDPELDKAAQAAVDALCALPRHTAIVAALAYLDVTLGKFFDVAKRITGIEIVREEAGPR